MAEHDARKLRTAAKWHLAPKANHYPVGDPLGDALDLAVAYILATVREDDGDDQPDATVAHSGVTVRVCRTLSMSRVSIDTGSDCVVLRSFPSLTRRQFRMLCEGLGVEVSSDA